MTVDVLGLGPSLNEFVPRGNVMVGVNDIWGRGIQADHVICVDTPGCFKNEPERMKWITGAKPKHFVSHRIEWSMMTHNFKLIKLSNIRGSLKDFDDPYIYPHSNNSTFVAAIYAHRIGAKRIVLWGCDFNDHPVLGKPDRIPTILAHYRDLKKALAIRNVELGVCSSKSALAAVMPVFR